MQNFNISTLKARLPQPEFNFVPIIECYQVSNGIISLNILNMKQLINLYFVEFMVSSDKSLFAFEI